MDEGVTVNTVDPVLYDLPKALAETAFPRQASELIIIGVKPQGRQATLISFGH